MWAAAENHAEAVKALVELGADVNAKSKVLSFPEFKWTTSGMVSTALPRGGWTPLMHAARQGSLEAGESARRAAQVDLNVVDPDGTTALVVAIINAHYDVAAMLLDKGADPNVADSTGTAALYALVDMHTLAPMQGRPAPKLVDKHRRRGPGEEADRQGRQPERPAAAADAGPISRLWRRHARRGHDAVPARGQGRGRAVDARAARGRRRSDADQEGSHQRGDARGGRTGEPRISAVPVPMPPSRPRSKR